MPLLQAKKQRGGLLSANPLLAIGQGLLQAGANGDNIGLGLANGLQGYEQGLRQQQEDELQGRQFQAQEGYYNAQRDRWTAEAKQTEAAEAQKAQQMQQMQQYFASLPDGDPAKRLAMSGDYKSAIELQSEIAKQQAKPSELQTKMAELQAANISPDSPEGRKYLGTYIEPRAPDREVVPVSDGQGGFKWAPRAQAVGQTAPAPAGTVSPAENSTKLRKEFNDLPTVKNYEQALPAYRAIEDAATRDTTQSDINVVYGLAKLYDPTSVVREGEYATVANSPNIPERVKGWASYIAGGGRLTGAVKAQILDEARGRIGTYESGYKKDRDSYTSIAERTGGDSSLVFPQPFTPAYTPMQRPEGQQAPPAIKFLGFE